MYVHILFPGTEEGEKECVVHTVCTCSGIVATVFARVRTYTGDIVSSLCWCASWCSAVQVSFISCCSMPSGTSR